MSQKFRRALIVIDVQNEYVTGNLPIEFPDVRLSLRNIGRAMDAATAAGIPVVVVQQSAPVDAPLFAKTSSGWQLHATVAGRHRDHYTEKTLPNAFTHTDLAEWIARMKIDTVTVAGYMIHNCVAATAVHALHAGLAVELLADATGAVSYANRVGRAGAEEIYRSYSVVLQSRFAAVLDTDEWIAASLNDAPVHRDSIFGSNQQARLVLRAA